MLKSTAKIYRESRTLLSASKGPKFEARQVTTNDILLEACETHDSKPQGK